MVDRLTMQGRLFTEEVTTLHRLIAARERQLLLRQEDPEARRREIQQWSVLLGTRTAAAPAPAWPGTSVPRRRPWWAFWRRA
jgi:hypothetical protein